MLKKWLAGLLVILWGVAVIGLAVFFAIQGAWETAVAVVVVICALIFGLSLVALGVFTIRRKEEDEE